MLGQKHTLVRKDAASGQCGLGAYIEPAESTLLIDDDGCGVGVGVVRADLLDVTSVARCAGVCHYNVEECEILLSVALETNFNSHCNLFNS